MMKHAFALIIFLLSFVCFALEVQENPYMEMVGKRHAENWIQYIFTDYYRFLYADTLEEQLIIKQLEETAKKPEVWNGSYGPSIIKR